jgi:ketosteroid isomerase-like protein
LNGSEVPFNLEQFINAFEKKDAEELGRFLTEDAFLQDGNNKPLSGKETISKALSDFFTTLKGIKFKIIRSWNHDDSVIVQGEVTFIIPDDSRVTLPFADIYY